MSTGAGSSTGPAALRVRLLGGFELRHGGTALPPLGSARAESLLAYLLLHQDAPQRRQRLAFLLWPDSTEPQALTNLRHLLHNLRRALREADRFLEVTPRTLRWRPDAPAWLDVDAFQEAVARAEAAGGDAELAAWREAADLHRGELLEGSDDEWLLAERERLHRRHLHALERLAALLEERGDQAQAIAYAERLLRHDPLHEATYRVLMRLYDARGDRARALRTYHACAATLERELGVEPSAPTRRAYEALLPADDGAAAAPREAGRTGPLAGPPLVGRAAQRARLTELWHAAAGGRAQLVLVTGEPGVGKTRLVDELRAWCAHRGVATAEARSYAAEGALAYGPVVAWLRAPALAGHGERLDRAHLGQLARLLPELRSTVPGLPRPEPDPPSGGDQRQPLFDALARALLAPGGPLLLVADDLQWADRETLRFLHYLLRVAPAAPLLVAATARREEVDQQHPLNDLVTGLRGLERLVEVELGRLSRQETATLAERVAGRPLEDADADLLFAETEGNPLFVVEALRAGWRGGERRPLSPKVQAVIEARLAQLSAPARDLVGVAAAIGREFTVEALAAASQTGEEALVGGLDELWRRRIVRDRGPEAYDFTHDRIREAAYLALSPARRRHVHQQVARALERLHADDPAPVAGQVAAHLECAGATEQAVAWYERAAEVARRLPANAEAVRLLERALALLRSLPRSPPRQARELAVLTALQPPLAAVEGYASDRLAEVQRRGLELAEELRVELQPPLLLALAVASLARGDFHTARRLGAELGAAGERDGDDVRVVEGAYLLGIAAFWNGEFAAARRHFERAVGRYHPEQRPAHLLQYGLDPKVVCTSRLGNTLWFLGQPAAAARARDAALALAQEIGHPHSRGVALVFAALLAVELGDPDRVREHTAALAASRQELSRPPRVTGDTLAGYVEVLDGRVQAGTARIRRALDDPAEGEHAPGLQAGIRRLLLAACVAARDARAGLAATDRELESGDHVRTWESEARRLRGEFLAALGAPRRQVEVELRQALEVARRQGAGMLELRAATSLLRHRLDGGGRQARGAGELLASVLDRLPEAAATPEAREADALLARC